MSNALQTFGEWEVSPAPTFFGGDYYYCIRIKGSSNSPNNIVRITCLEGEEKMAHAIANLVAAAPDLLAACEAYLNATTQAQLDTSLIATKSAIAKARGQA